MRYLLSFVKWIFGLTLLGIIAGALTVSAVYLYFEPKLPDVNKLRDVRLQTPLRIFSADNKLIAEFGEKRRTPISFNQIPTDFVHALQAAEDARFFEHFGIDPKGLMRAAVQLATTGHIQSGGSTITMQVAKNYFLTPERTFSRKFMELMLALKIERELTKEEILELYINKIYLGHRAYGIQAAATVYYGEDIGDLSLAQMAMIAGLPKAPSAYNPITNPSRALERRNWILGRMQTLGYISEQQYQQAITDKITARYHGSDIELYAPYIAEMVRAELYAQYGDSLYSDGLNVYTTIDSKLQNQANRSLQKGLVDFTERHGYRGPEKQVDLTGLDHTARLDLLRKTETYSNLVPALVTQVDDKSVQVLLGNDSTITLDWDALSWARPYKTINYVGAAPNKASDIVKVGDLIRLRDTGTDSENPTWQLTQIPKVQGAFVALNPNDGAILSLTGGFSFALNKFNRASQAYRQPGSNMKPFLYTAALENGYTPASVFNDAPIVYHDVSLDGNWRPENDNGKFSGPTRLREALYHSRNLVSIRLLRALGIETGRDFILKFGFDPKRVPANLSLALGTADVTPLQLVTGYASFANGGYRINNYLIKRVADAEGNTLFTAAPAVACMECEDNVNPVIPADESTDDKSGQPMQISQAERVISEESAFQIYSIMQDVIRRGTGVRALKLNRPDIAGKTGTTNEQKDAWFSGYNQNIVATTYVGFDQPSTLGRHEFGSSAALPIWINFMGEALKDTPVASPKPPAGIVRAAIDPETGLLAYPGQPNATGEYFRRGTVPTERAKSPEEQKEAPTTEQLFGGF